VRRRLVVSTIAIVMVVLGAMAVPVGQIIQNSAEEQLDARLEQQAATIAAAVSDAAADGRVITDDAIRDLLGPSDGVQVVASDGRVIIDLMPNGVTSARVSTRTAINGSIVTMVTDADPLDASVRRQLLVLLFLAFGGIAAAAGLAAVQGHQLARPLEKLASRATRLGTGDFSRQPPIRTHIPEIDDIGNSLDTSASRLDTLLGNERHFTADATHQLRTGIAGIAMRVEIMTMRPEPEVAAEARTILEQTDQLNRTIDDLLAVARNRTDSDRVPFDLEDLVDAHVADWMPRFTADRRRLVVSRNSPAVVLGTKGLAGQVIDIMLDNALRHSSAAVHVRIDGSSVTVIDYGPGMSELEARTAFDGPVDPAARHGRGLPLARRLAHVDGATLTIAKLKPFAIEFRLVRNDKPAAATAFHDANSPSSSSV
jgi:signal transduction histidine kinase